MDNPRPELEPEQNNGKYRPIADLGQGGTANVYLAVARGPSDFNKLVVLKMLKRELADETDFRNMFLSEARLSARLNHPNVVQTYEILQAGGRPIIVMEYLEGQALSRLVARTRGEGAISEFPLSMHLRILCESLSGLHYAHELTDYSGKPMGLVHRDMTPQNVFVSYDGRVCLLDFGIAKLATTAKEMQTAVGVLKGKLRYMPAEQLLGQNVDLRADIFAVGVMLWEAATGQRMWQGVAETNIMQRVAFGELPTPRSVNPSVPEELEHICMKALAHKPEDRYSTAAELQAALEEYLNKDPVTPRAIGKFVDKVFRDERAQIRAMIERQLAGLENEPAVSPESATEWDLPQAQAIESSNSADMAVTQPDRKVVGKRTVFAASVAIAISVVLALWTVGPSSQHVSAARNDQPQPEFANAQLGTARASSRGEPEEAPAPKQIQLRVSVLPAVAQLSIDGVALPSNPYSAALPTSPEQHTLRAEAPGYVPEVRYVTYADNLSLELMLEEVKVAAPAPSAPTRRGRASARATNAAAAAPAQPVAAAEADDPCEIPYEIDPDGIRRLKKACLKQ